MVHGANVAHYTIIRLTHRDKICYTLNTASEILILIKNNYIKNSNDISRKIYPL